MDLSALIFVALAIAWAAYLVPKALKYHEDGASSRSVDRFSHRMRVLARREPVDSRNARLVVRPGRGVSSPAVSVKPRAGAPVDADAPVSAPVVEAAAPVAPARTPSPQARREAARRAAQRRRRVLGVLLVLNVLVAGLAIARVVHPAVIAAPVVLLVAWLVACRLMVRRERGIGRSVAPRSAAPAAAPAAVEVEIERAIDPALDPELTTDIPAVVDDEAPVESPVAAPGMWDPVPVTLPTYVAKPPAARRAVRTIDLDSTGVWTSGRTEADASLAREAEEAERAARTRREADGGRAFGS